MSESTVWWLLSGAFIAVELLTGSFYLLMLATGMAAAAIAAHWGASSAWQMLTAACVGAGSVCAWYWKQKMSPSEPPAQANPDIHLDIGETVQIDTWNADGSASVQYRGAHWSVMHRPGVTPSSGAHRVAEIIGNRLLVEKI